MLIFKCSWDCKPSGCLQNKPLGLGKIRHAGCGLQAQPLGRDGAISDGTSALGHAVPPNRSQANTFRAGQMSASLQIMCQ